MPQTVVIAGEQRVGRGRDGNVWHSPPGGIYMTWLGGLDVDALMRVPLAAGVAAVESVAALGASTPARLKWPNDVQVEGRKLAGILCQTKVFGSLAWVMVGIGVNVVPVSVPGPAGHKTACLRELGVEVNGPEAARRFAAAFVPAFNRLVSRRAEIRAAWLSHSVHRDGDPLRVRFVDGAVTGVFRGLSVDGALLLERDGKIETITAARFVAAIDDVGD